MLRNANRCLINLTGSILKDSNASGNPEHVREQVMVCGGLMLTVPVARLMSS